MKMNRSLFYKFFPVPEYLEMRSAGFDLSDDSLRFAEISSRGGEIKLENYGEYPIPPGVISLGRIQEADTLRELLRKVKKEHRVKFVRVSIPESQAYRVEMEISKVKKKEIRESVELRLEEYVPMKADEVFFDYDLAETSKQKPGVFTVVATVVPKEIMLSYAQVFASAGLATVSAEAGGSALSRAVVPEGDLGTFMIVDAGKTKTSVYVVSGGLVRFVSDAETGGNSVVSAFEKNLSLSRTDAEALKEKYSSETLGDTVPKDPQTEAVQKSLSAVFSDLTQEINKYFLYWHTRKETDDAPNETKEKREKIEKIILVGSESFLCGLRGHLSSGLRVPVETGNVWTNLFSFDEDIPKVTYRDSVRFGTAIGLALFEKPR